MDTVAISLLELLKEVIEKKTPKEIVDGAGITTSQPSRFVAEAKTNKAITFALADYVLNQTIGKKGGLWFEEAMAKLRAAGLTPPQVSAVAQIVMEFQQMNRWREEEKKETEALRIQLADITIDHAAPGLVVTATKPDASEVRASPALPPDLSEKLLLSREESQALYGFAAQQLDAGRLEHPLTRAVRKISTLISRGIVPAELPPSAVSTAETTGLPSTASPTPDTPERPAQRPRGSPVVSASPSSSSSPRKKKGK